MPAGAVAVAADDPDPDPTKRVAAEDEAKRLEGVWEVVYYEFNGTAEPQEMGMKVVFSRAGVRMGDDGEWAYRVDPRKEPAWIDVELNTHRGGGAIRGIYRREGDRMVLCYRLSSPLIKMPRPADFRGASSKVLMTLRRMRTAGK